jgi:hypothetical protein
MNELLEALGLKAKAERAIDQVQAKIGEWLSIPNQLRIAADQASDPAQRQRIAELQGMYTRTKPTVEAGLAIAQKAAATQTLPALKELGVVIEAAAIVADTTKTARGILAGSGRAVDGEGIGTAWKVFGGLVVGFGVYKVATAIASKRRRRRS